VLGFVLDSDGQRQTSLQNPIFVAGHSI
jgi:hypothetical protein